MLFQNTIVVFSTGICILILALIVVSCYLRKRLFLTERSVTFGGSSGISTLLDNNHLPTRTTTVLYEDEVRKEIPDSKGF